MDIIIAAWVITGVVAFLPIARVLIDLRKEDHFSLWSLAGVALFCILFWPGIVMWWSAHRKHLKGEQRGK